MGLVPASQPSATGDVAAVFVHKSEKTKAEEKVVVTKAVRSSRPVPPKIIRADGTIEQG